MSLQFPPFVPFRALSDCRTGVVFEGGKPLDVTGVTRFGEPAGRTEPPAGVKIAPGPGRLPAVDRGVAGCGVADPG